MKTKLITIITVCLNSAKTIKRTLNSVLPQLEDDIEYIIIDGASSDKTLDIINSYGDRRIKLISEKDNGIYDAMNKGIKKSRGKWIYFLNSDDWLMENTLGQIKGKLLNSDKYDFVYGGVIIHKLINGKHWTKRWQGINEVHLAGLKTHMNICHQALFVKRSVFHEIGLFDTSFRIGADWDFTLRGYLKGYRFLRINMMIANFSGGGACSKSYILEKHRIRKKNGVLSLIDFRMFYDIMNFIEKNTLKVFSAEDYGLRNTLGL